MGEASKPPSLDELGQRIEKAKAARKPDQPTEKGSSGLGVAWRMSTELVVAVFVGWFIGYLIDRWLDTAPWAMVIFLFLGIAAGLLTVYRTAESMSKPADDAGQD